MPNKPQLTIQDFGGKLNIDGEKTRARLIRGGSWKKHPEFAAIGGLYFTKGPGGVAQIWGDPKDPTLNFRPQVPLPGSLQECCGTGMGFTLFRLAMFKDVRLRRPWFKTMKGPAGVSTQDLYAWGDFRKYGYRCAVDTSVMVGHYSVEEDIVW